MANIKSSKKRILTNERNRQRNIAAKSRIKTLWKKADEAVESKDAEAINSTLNATLSEIDRATSKGVFHKSTAARKKSQLQRNAATALKG
ncbi:MAG: 30S ribosomal protein S20 [Candidatus Hydrogenedentota bacterium]|nr:MAG: 30S ribosomal protein S20 [Candidatus Hydrogenedentota bacterium]